MEVKQVNSSAMSRVGFDEETNVLVIKFQQGDLYYYWPIQKPLFENLVTANSKGRFFDKNLKNRTTWVKDLLETHGEDLDPPSSTMCYLFKRGRDVESFKELATYVK